MKYAFFTNSERAWDGLLDSIQLAQKSVYIEMYIFVDDGPLAKQCIDTLALKAKAGISVRLILDSFGSADLSEDAQHALKDAGVEVLFFRKFFRRLHRKIIIVDEKIGFVGGVNIHQSAQKWNDLLVRVEGSIVHSLVRSFSKVYRACEGTDPYLLKYKRKKLLDTARIWFMEHLPSILPPRLKNAYKEALLGAHSSAIIITPYFLPHRWLKKLLIQARDKGISIEILVPAHTDIWFITKANYIYMRLMAEYGIKFYLGPKMNHSKLLLIDEKRALVGSQNIDALSFDHNAEAGIFFDDPQMIAELRIIVDQWKQESLILDTAKRPTIAERMFSYFVRLIDFFL